MVDILYCDPEGRELLEDCRRLDMSQDDFEAARSAAEAGTRRAQALGDSKNRRGDARRLNTHERVWDAWMMILDELQPNNRCDHSIAGSQNAS